MYKIEMRCKHNGSLCKKKLYETEKMFIQWKKKHLRHYSMSYTFKYFKFINVAWKKYNFILIAAVG